MSSQGHLHDCKLCKDATEHHIKMLAPDTDRYDAYFGMFANPENERYYVGMCLALRVGRHWPGIVISGEVMEETLKHNAELE